MTIAIEVTEQAKMNAILEAGLLLPSDRWDFVKIISDEHGFGCTLTDTAAVGLGATAGASLRSALISENPELGKLWPE